MANLGYWLVKTGMGQSEVQQYPAGQSPPSVRWGQAVYLGPTAADAKAFTPIAAAKLGVPNPQNVPTLSTSVGIISSILGGFGGGAAGAIDAVGAEGAAVASTATADVATTADAAGTGAAAGAGGGIAGSTLIKGAGLAGVTAAISSTTDFLQWVAWLFHPRNWLRVAEFVSGGVLLIFGLNLTFGGSRRSPLRDTGAGIARVTRKLGAATPAGRAQRMARGRRAGKYEGEVEHARLQARRETRQREAARSS